MHFRVRKSENSMRQSIILKRANKITQAHTVTLDQDTGEWGDACISSQGTSHDTKYMK